jgi:hypothetical protein
MNIQRKANYDAILRKLRHPEKRTWIIMNPGAIGETAMMCGFAKSFIETHGYGITMVIRPEHTPITSMYPGRFEQVIEVSKEEMDGMMRYFPPDQFEVDVPFAAFPYFLGDARADRLTYLYKYPGRGGLSFNDVYRHILMLPWDAPIERPQVPREWELEARRYADEIGLEPGKSVILFPSANTVNEQFPDMLWESLAERLNENGCKVYCNMTGGRYRPSLMPVANTIPIEVPLRLGLTLVSIAGRMISLPHGFQYFQTVGGDFTNISVLLPFSGKSTDVVYHTRTYDRTFAFCAYMCPELIADLPRDAFLEFMMPTDASEEEFRRFAMAVADQDTCHPAIVRRQGMNGGLFCEEHSDWLRPLAGPRRTHAAVDAE